MTTCASWRASGLRLAVVTNIPAPYRVPVYNRLAREPNINLRAFYAARTEPDRQWDLPPFEHAHQFLKGRMHERAGRFIHNNPDVWAALRGFNPDVVMTTGFNPTHLLAFAFARLNRRAHVVVTDGTDVSEQSLGTAHRLVRRAVFAGTKSFVVASRGGRRLLQSYGVAEHLIHTSPLSANTAVNWSPLPHTVRDLDFLFSGRLVPIKNADFALNVAHGVAQRLGRRLSMGLLGSGAQETALRALAATYRSTLDVQFAGHVSQSQVPAWFQRTRVFLFPTQWDPWGVVANEACLAGVPVLVSPHAGAAGDLIRDGVNGRVLTLELPTWIDAASELLSQPEMHSKMANAAREAVKAYGFDEAADGMADAARQAVARPD